MRIIGFNGTMGVGKSTAVGLLEQYLIATFEQGSTLIKFAQPLYDIQEFIYERIYDVYERPETFVKDRKLLQWLGTDWGRGTISDTLWVDLWKARALRATSFNSVVICDDVRFNNEAATIKEMGGIVVKLTSNRADDRIDTKSGIVSHASEAGISDKYVDFIIENNGTLHEFETSLCKFFMDFGIGQSDAVEHSDK